MRDWNLKVYNIEELSDNVKDVILADFRADECCWDIVEFKDRLINDVKNSNELINKYNMEIALEFGAFEDNIPNECQIQVELWDKEAIEFVDSLSLEIEVNKTLRSHFEECIKLSIGDFNGNTLVDLDCGDAPDILINQIDDVSDTIQAAIYQIEDELLERAISIAEYMLTDDYIIKFISEMGWEFTEQGIHTDFIKYYKAKNEE